MVLRAAVFAFVLAAASSAQAAKVYLNGVEVDGLANQSFSNAKVTFDAQGNVRIEAAGIEVKTMTTGGATAPTAAPARPTKHYFLVPQQSVVGMTGYDIDVFIDGTWVTRFRNDEQENPLDVTKYVAVGANKVLFTAHKAAGDRKSFSPEHTFTVLVGEGSAGADQVVIDNPLLTFKRTAADTDDVTQEFTFTGR